MQPIQSITIPQPCHESWNQMTPVEQGRHCAACSKTVTDFTKMSNQQIINYFAQNGKLCGRFEKHQLPSLNAQLAAQEKPGNFWTRLAIAAAVTGLFATISANAQTTIGKVRVTQAANPIKSEPVSDSVTYEILQGKIISGDDKLPIIGASVAVKNKAIGAMTDVNGNFKLRVPFDSAQTLVISFIGYQRMEVNTSIFLNSEQTVTLQMSQMIMGDIRIIQRPGFVKRCWNKFKRVF